MNAILPGLFNPEINASQIMFGEGRGYISSCSTVLRTPRMISPGEPLEAGLKDSSGQGIPRLFLAAPNSHKWKHSPHRRPARNPANLGRAAARNSAKPPRRPAHGTKGGRRSHAGIRAGFSRSRAGTLANASRSSAGAVAAVTIRLK